MPSTPPYVTALVSALSFRGAQPESLQVLDDSEWQELLVFGDRMHLTIPLAQACSSYCPDWVRARIAENIADNARRFQVIKNAYNEIAGALTDANVDHLVLKGFTKWPDYVPHASHRMQSDIDLFCSPESIFRARDAIHALGYESQHGVDDMPWVDHLPILQRKTDWQWRGNAYDPEMPLSIELHHCLWDCAAAGCGPEFADQFWQRRVHRNLEEITFPALSKIDSLGYLAINLLRDLLRADIVSSQVYELAWFLHRNSTNDDFWKGWTGMHDPELRRLESVSFLLAKTWFHCDLPQAAEAEIGRLPLSTRRWFEAPATTPSPMGWMRPNKDRIWLHSSLVKSTAEKRKIIFGRLLPKTRPVEVVLADQIPDGSPAKESMSYRYRRYAEYLFARTSYHLRILPITLWHGLCWWWSART
jgi:Uncharacterised nucleotidyltransferase